jgi:hypothetical protein
MPGLRKAIVLSGIFVIVLTLPETKAPGFPLHPVTVPESPLLNYVHGHHCGWRYSAVRGWHRHPEACRDRDGGPGWGWCWPDASGNQLCIGDIRRRDPAECRSNPYALGCRTEHWDNR